MPSWNIHTAHVEKLLRTHSPQELGIRDVNAFLFGNYVPDVYVGYMVKNITRKIAYRETHFTDPGYVPEPRFWEFWREYALPSADAAGRVSDVCLGAWCHLVADNGYNHEVNAYIERIGVKPGEQTRIRKQGDFDLFGRTLDISMECVVDTELLRQAAGFPQYAIGGQDVREAVRSACAIVEANQRAHIAYEPTYSLLTAGDPARAPIRALKPSDRTVGSATLA